MDQGYELAVASPKGIIYFAFQESILNNEQLWLDMLESRNLSSHDYGEEVSAEIAEKISNRYCKELTELSKTVANYLK
ncbi:MAG: nucleotidyltransferase substrate binding protein [Clostridia bacterium]|nr:nucleotidyltransferase substrate binding protein [Clostridia bacterium]